MYCEVKEICHVQYILSSINSKCDIMLINYEKNALKKIQGYVKQLLNDLKAEICTFIKTLT